MAKRLSITVFLNWIYCTCTFCVITYYIIAVRQYFAIAIILVDQNHVIRLLQCNNIAMYAIH